MEIVGHPLPTSLPKKVADKGTFFQKVRFIFQISQSPPKIIQKNYPEFEIWNSRPYQ